MKRISVLLLAALMLVCIAGCGAKKTEPEKPGEEAGVFSFTTKTLEGAEVKSEDIFAENKITMVNIWAAWCGPCVRELPELQKLSAELNELDCGLVGIIEDVRSDSDAADAKQLVASNALTYPVILSNEEIRSQITMQYFPTTIFVDSTGRIVGEPVIGARVDQYLPAVRALLQGDSN